jgi:6-phosphofructokinase 1
MQLPFPTFLSALPLLPLQVLGQGAVHGAFAGYTGFTVGLVNTHYVYLPIPTIIQAPRKVNPKGRRWNR